MKHYLFTTLALLCVSATLSAQQASFTYAQFEREILAFTPSKSAGISDRAHSLAMRIMEDTKSATKNDPANFNMADYFNVLSMFLSLNESDENVQLAYRKFAEAEESCRYLTAFRDKVIEIEKYDPVREQWLADAASCEAEGKVNRPKPIDPVQYAQKHGFDPALIQTIAAIDEADGRHRKTRTSDWARKQTPLDKANQRQIDSLFAIHGKYLGASLVGEKFGLTMWSVIQHSNVEMMQRYLETCHQAFLHGELAEPPFRMLLDRYYILKHGYQLFGTQSGFNVDIADEETRQAVKKKYGLK